MTRAELIEAMARYARDKWLEDSLATYRAATWPELPDADKDYWRRDAVTALAAIEAAGMAVVPAGLWQTLHNGLNCVIHEEDNDPPDVANAVRIARATLDEARAMIAASPVEARDE